MIERWCGICKAWTQQIYIEQSERWSCDVCNTLTEDSLGCKISLVVQGKPVAKERPRATVRGGYAVVYTPKNTVQFEKYVKLVASDYAPLKLLTGALDLRLDFYVQRPQSLPVSVDYMVKRPDVDNLAKSVMDALEGVLYEHDAQVFVLAVTKAYGTPRVEIKIVEMPSK